jgi:hypothetical protein
VIGLFDQCRFDYRADKPESMRWLGWMFTRAEDIGWISDVISRHPGKLQHDDGRAWLDVSPSTQQRQRYSTM